MKRSIMLCIFLCIFVFSIYPAAYSAVEFKVNVNFYYGAVGDTKPEGAVGVYPLNWQSNALGTLWEREEGELGWTESDRPWRMTLNLTIDGSFFALVLPSGEDETDISGNLDGLTFYKVGWWGGAPWIDIMAPTTRNVTVKYIADNANPGANSYVIIPPSGPAALAPVQLTNDQGEWDVIIQVPVYANFNGTLGPYEVTEPVTLFLLGMTGLGFVVRRKYRL